MTVAGPVFTVIMATWGRGRHILPSITSVLQQDFADFELIVVGDACTDDTKAVVAGITDPRVRWINLPTRCGSQSAPNNAGIAASRGGVIAYLGHDDLWEPSHLARLAAGLRSSASPDFVVSGIISYLPEGVPGSSVRGLFTDDAAKHLHFFPPSSFAHRKSVTDRIGIWKMPMEIPAPVDEDFLLRAAAADLRFVSTGVVTVHKFTSAARYLSYVRQSSSEQQAMLARMKTPGHAAQIGAMIDQAKRLNTFMPLKPRNFDRLPPGDLARTSAENRGLAHPELRALGTGATIRQRVESCANDWRGKPVLGIRLNTKNPKPRFLLPFSATGQVALRFRVVHHDRSAFGPMPLTCNEQEVTARPLRVRPSLWGWTAIYEAVVRLLPDEPSILVFHLAPSQCRKLPIGRAGVGFGIGWLDLRPLPNP